jgi:hypothetical protein
MSQDSQGTKPEEEGGYGTPTPEQELGGAAGAGTTGAGAAGAGPSGGTDDQPHAGADTNDPGVERDEPPVPRDVDVPSAEAEIDESNADSQGSEPFSSEPGQEASGVPDGSGNDLPKEKAPNDDDEESFDAG